MKNKILVRAVILLSLIVIVTSGLLIAEKNRTYYIFGAFNLSDYQKEIENETAMMNVGVISDASDAARKAQDLLESHYGVKLSYKAYGVDFNEENKAYFIYGVLLGQLDTYQVGGVPYVILADNGDVLAMWRDY